ncbi:MAG: SGNH/GDSL hydrolase family protein [Clostridia bacterium]|nr:SGNH/GDSL hydrolase family protein [Clostridia bacterium]
MDFFKTFSSNTYAAGANQHIFHMPCGEIRTGRVFYKIANGGTYNYSLLFTNILDSTYADGSVSHRNLICDSWKILSARVGKCSKDVFDTDFLSSEAANQINEKTADFVSLKFDGKDSKTVSPGEFFCCDAFPFSFESGDYLCLEITFTGTTIPYHEETLLPVFKKSVSGWEYSRQMPFAHMIGCDREVKLKIGYLGDSITQGIGAPHNSYKHWNALLSQRLGSDNAYWNLGIGFARANDAATDGAWLYKAKQNDVLFVCLGVNDIIQGCTCESLMLDLCRVVDLLKKEGKKIVLQTVPPFDYNPDDTQKWLTVNKYILSELSKKVDFVFDVVPALQKSQEQPQAAKYGGHPNAEGGAVWADALYNALKSQG